MTLPSTRAADAAAAGRDVRRAALVLLAAMLALVALLFPPAKTGRVARPSAAARAHPKPSEAPLLRPAPLEPTHAPSRRAADAADFPAMRALAMPRVGTRSRHRRWVNAKFGRGEDDVGLDYLGGSTESRPPQGFVVTPAGSLLVLDSNKLRILEYDASGRKLRAIELESGLVAPVDIAVARDGTMLVVDLGGVQTGGILMLRPDGTKLRELPRYQPSDMMGMYATGDDFWFDMGHDSIHGGDSSGSISDETPGVYNYEDSELVPGRVAPDGRTVIDLGVEEEGGLERGEFFVDALRGEPAEHRFTRWLKWPGPLAAALWAQADAHGQIYVVLLDKPMPQHEMLLCLDTNGDPVGLADLGVSDDSPGTMFRRWSVAPEGGLVYLRQHPNGVSYEWADCH